MSQVSFDRGLSKTKFSSNLVGLKVTRDTFQAETFLDRKAIATSHHATPNQ
jgi:hypothetical protein